AAEAALMVLEPAHFCEQVHAAIWSATTNLVAEGRPVNPVSLGASLGNDSLAPDLTMRQYLARIAADTSCTANFVIETAKQVRDFWALRKLAAKCEAVRATALMPGVRPRELISSLIQDADAVRATLHGRSSMGRSASEAIANVVARIEQQEAGEIVDTCVTTGLCDLDRKLIGGFKAGQLIV